MKRYKPTRISFSTSKSKQSKNLQIETVHPNSAGIDIGSRSHFVAIPPDSTENNVREFGSTTTSLFEMVTWLKKYRIKTIAMESTGSYWIPVYEILESYGFEVYLVNAQMIKNVPGRKTDVLDCQWIQKLHTFGFLSKSFRPKDHCLKLRSLCRQHSSLIEHRSPHILHMQKALQEMNVQLHTHVRDITGVTGMNIINAIIAGERDPKVFASLVDRRCKNSPEAIADSLKGNYREEHLFFLKQAKDLYEFYNQKINEVELEIQNALNELSLHAKKATPDFLISQKPDFTKGKNKSKANKGLSFSPDSLLTTITSVDLTEIPGINQTLALKIVAELGGSVDAWKSPKHFASWLGLCPGNKVSGGRNISGKTKRCVNRVSQCLRMAANALWNAKNYLGAYLRRQRGRLGGMKAITATAHKLARIIYVMIKEKINFCEFGEEHYEKIYQARRLKALQKQAKEMGMNLIPIN